MLNNSSFSIQNLLLLLYVNWISGLQFSELAPHPSRNPPILMQQFFTSQNPDCKQSNSQSMCDFNTIHIINFTSSHERILLFSPALTLKQRGRIVTAGMGESAVFSRTPTNHTVHVATVNYR